MTFPADVPIPNHVHQRREKRIRELTYASFRAMGLRGALITIELLGFTWFGAYSLLLDALSSCLDLIFSFTLLVCLRAAKTPPDENHPFGHGRIEPIAGLLTSSMLIEVGLYLAWQQIQELPNHPETIDPRAGLFALAAAGIMQICYYLMKQYGQRHHSTAILAEAAHYRIDALNSLIACLALAMAAIFPEHGAIYDRLGAMFISLMMVYLGFQAAKSNFDQLIDRRPSQELFDKIRLAALSVTGVKETEKIRIQHYGPDAHVDIDIEVDPVMSVHDAHTISQFVRRAIQAQWPAVRDVTVHIEPFFEGDHTHEQGLKR